MDTMKTFFTSDTHYYHHNVISYSSREFLNVEEMNREMIRRWNEVVGPRDRVYHVGDFAFANKEKAKDILSKLNGYIILIKGNHDGSPTRMKEIGFKEVYDHLEIEIAGKKVLLCHYPYRPSEEELATNTYKLKNVDSRPIDNSEILLHGHVHNLWKFKRGPNGGMMINVSVENWNYTPVSLETIEQIIKDNPNGFTDTIKV